MPSFEVFCSLHINSIEPEANSASDFCHVSSSLLLTSPFGRCEPCEPRDVNLPCDDVTPPAPSTMLAK